MSDEVKRKRGRPPSNVRKVAGDPRDKFRPKVVGGVSRGDAKSLNEMQLDEKEKRTWTKADSVSLHDMEDSK